MLPKLKNTQTFQKEINNYKKDILLLDNEDAKEKGLRIINQLMHQAHIIDQVHSPIGNTSVDPRTVRENVETISKLRFNLKKLIKESK